MWKQRWEHPQAKEQQELPAITKKVGRRGTDSPSEPSEEVNSANI
jgi:hypothetical protein